MISSRQELIQAITTYTSSFPEELAFKDRFLELLRSEGSFQRDHLPGHITGSAFIIDESKKITLLTHHAKLDKWLQPGGHADGEENIFNVALREAEEETGIKNFKIMNPGIFDLDIHPIPSRGSFPEHLHFDIRILLQASYLEKYIVSEESHDLAWIKLEDIVSLTKNESLLRMAMKVT